jgi:NADH:ubiquinone oxidoreductase subunit 5 (subunit L)/multisubunit Na+/H+ antiporter MnhA subunit
MNGLAKIMPVWAFFFCLFAFASVGLPGLNGFIGEFLTMIGTFNSREVNGSPILGPWYAILAATGVIIAAIYLLFLVGKIVFGPLNLPHWEDTGETGIAGGHDLSYREAMTLTPIAAICLIIGLYPYPILRSLEPAIQEHTQYVHDEIDKMEAEAEESQIVERFEFVPPRRQDAKEDRPKEVVVIKELEPIILTQDRRKELGSNISDEEHLRTLLHHQEEGNEE